jgi:hypothetical protein
MVPPELHALRRVVGAGAEGTCGTRGAALHQEVGVGAAPGATPSREEGAGAPGTRGAPGPAPSPEVGAGATRTRGAPKAALHREVGARAVMTHGSLKAALSRKVGAEAGYHSTAPSSAPFRARSGRGCTYHTPR